MASKVTYKFEIKGMSCAACQRRVEKAISKVKGVDLSNVNLLTNTAYVEGSFSKDDVIKSVKDAGYDAKLLVNKISIDNSDEIKTIKKRLITSLILILPILYITMGHNMLNTYI